MQLEDIREEVKKLKKYAELLETPDEFFRHMNGHVTELSFVLSAFTLANESENILSALEMQIPKVVDARAVRAEAMTIYWALKKCEDTGLTPEEIMDGKLLTGWIPVVEKLPEEPSAGLTEMEDLQEYIVMIDGAELSTVLSYAGNGEWYRDGDFYKVLAWMPLPEPYRPEALREAREEAGQDAAAQVLQSAT